MQNLAVIYSVLTVGKVFSFPWLSIAVTSYVKLLYLEKGAINSTFSKYVAVSFISMSMSPEPLIRLYWFVLGRKKS